MKVALALLLAAVLPLVDGSLTFEMDRWMGDVFSAEYSDVLLKDIILPGSHDAGAYRIMDTNGDIPSCGQVDLGDVPDWLLEQLIDLERTQERGINFVETQRVSVYEQLVLGIRYLDLRLGWYQPNQEIRLHHTLFMDVTFEEVLSEIAMFSSNSPTEVVILKMKLQCGTPFDGVQDLLISVLGDIYGGPLTKGIMSSEFKTLQGKAFVIFDESDSDTAEAMGGLDENTQRSISQESYYRVNPCDNEGNNCWAWPDYTQDQGKWLETQIAMDIATPGSQLSIWKEEEETTADIFRILSFIGVIPLGHDCTPSPTRLFTATLSCERISIYSYTETFQYRFLDLLAALEANQMNGAINVIQLDYVDTFPLEALVRLNEEVALQVTSSDATTSSSISRDNSPSIFPEAARRAGMRLCWEDLQNDNGEELSASYAVKLYDDYNCQGRQLTKYSNDDNLQNDVIERIWLWVRKHWNDRVKSITIGRCARTKLPQGEQQCVPGTFSNVRLVLYPDSDYRGTPLTLTCSTPEEDSETTSLEVADNYTMEIGSYVKTQMACSFNLPDAWVGRVSSLQIQQSPVSTRRIRWRRLEQQADETLDEQWKTLYEIPDIRSKDWAS